MLIRFTVENFLSFKDEVEFSMIPGKGRKHPEHVVSNGKRRSTNALKAAVIYGANASGKSNLIKAMDFAKHLIVLGRRPRRKIPVTPFKFDKACEDKPSKFQFEFRHNSKAFIYGFTLDTDRIHEEWLYEITSSTEKLIFERTTSADGETDVDLSNMKFRDAKEQGFLEYTAMGTRPNQLFLTESIERDIDCFEDIFNWFDNVLVLIFPQARRAGLELDFMTNQDFQKSLKNFLQLFDTGIADVGLIEFEFDEEPGIPEDFKVHIREQSLAAERKETPLIASLPDGRSYLILNENGEIKALKFMAVHTVKGENRNVLLDITEESDGTQRLFHLIPALIELLAGEHVIIVDELDRSLHPHLSREIIKLFLTVKPQQPSQLIVTTHEASLLDLNLLRRDEIWFIEKNKDGVSTIYSLEEFAPRYDKDIRKGYLLGRFGAIPFIKDVAQIDWVK